MPPNTNYRDVVLADAPVGYWRLGETGGTSALDSSSNGRNGSYVGGPTLNQPGVVSDNGAASFNGSSQYGEVPYAAALNPAAFSVEAWVKVTGGASSWRSVITSRDAPGGSLSGYILYAGADNTWQLWLGRGSGWYTLRGPAITLGAWTHLVGTFDGSAAKLYVNGVLAASGSLTGFSPNGARPLRFAAGRTESATATYPLPGSLDELAVYPTTLNAARVQAHWNAASP